MPTIGSTTSLKPDQLGPHQRVTPTNRAGLANADDAPQIVAPTAAGVGRDMRRADINTQILVTLRAISRQLAEGFGLADEPNALTDDEEISLGPDSNS